MESGRVVFDQFLRGAPDSRPAFVPLLQGVIARVEGVAREALEADPTLWANALMKTAELLEVDGVVAGFDFTLLAEACGAEIRWEDDLPHLVGPAKSLPAAASDSGRLGNLREAAGRVFQVCRAERACLIALTGPVTLAAQVFGPEEFAQRLGELKPMVVKVAESFCQIRPDVMVFMEGKALTGAEVNAAYRRMYTTLKNMAAYYNIPVALYLEGYDPEQVQWFSSLNADIYIAGPSLAQSLPPLSALWTLAEGVLGVGIGVPGGDGEKAQVTLQEAVECRRQGKRNFFFTSIGPLTRDVDLESLRQVLRAIKQIGVES